MKWYAVRAATRQEKKAFKTLADFGFSVYLPVETRRHKNEKKHVPLFDGYLFIACAEEHFRVVREIDGVHQFVCYYNRAGVLVPMPIPVSELRKVFIAEQEGQFDRTLSKAFKPQAGDRVRVSGGKYGGTGLIGTILSLTAKDRRALVSVDGSWAKLEFDAEHLEELA